MSRRAHLIFNPVAGQGDPIQDLDYIRRVLEPTLDLTVWGTTPDQDADVLAHQALAEGSQLIIASGGDGTLSAAATALLGSDVPFGVISRGTANAFANALGIPDTLEAACDTLLHGLERRVDSALCHQGDKSRAMILLAGIGFEAATVEMADRGSKDRFGMMAYLLSGLRQLRQIKMFDAQIETDEQLINVRASAITVANAAPSTSILAHGPAGVIPDDGLLDITIISCEGFSTGIMAGFHLLQSALSGNPAEREDIGYFRAKRVTISTEPAQSVVMDGEILETAPISIDCQPQSLTIMVPRTTQGVIEQKLEGLPGLPLNRNQWNQKLTTINPPRSAMTLSFGALFADAPLIVAHRGQPGEQENTLAAFEQAMRWGSHMIELDIRRCGDGTLVVHHDADVNGIPLAQMTLEQIRHSKAVPTLSQTIATVKDRIRLDVELKEADYESSVVKQLLEGLDPTQFFLTSFDAALVKSIKQQWPDLTAGLLVDDIKPLDQVALNLWAETRTDILLPHWSLLPADVDLAGIPLMPWTVNDADRIRQFLQQPEVLGVITDLPEQALGIRARLK